MKQVNNATQGINIYLAGKISKNDWRHKIVHNLRSACIDFEGNGIPEQWPVLKDGIAKNRHYVGPYFLGCDHGCYHGKDSHGYGPGCGPDGQDYPGVDYDHHCPESSREEYIVKQCYDAILRADVVFAWIDDLTAFGTMFELGIAVGNKKRVVLASPDDSKPVHNKVPFTNTVGEDDVFITNHLWFMFKYIETQPNGIHLYEKDAITAFNQLLEILKLEEKEANRESKIESPIERQFYNAMGHDSRLEPQYEIVANGHNYRADFAIPDLKIVIELDGHEYHKTKEQRTNDTRRERDLQMEGWKVIRFTGTEIAQSARDCAQDTYKLIRMAKA